MISIKTILSTFLTLGLLVVFGIVMLGINDPTGLSTLIGGMFIFVALFGGLIWFAGSLKHFK